MLKRQLIPYKEPGTSAVNEMDNINGEDDINGDGVRSADRISHVKGLSRKRYPVSSGMNEYHQHSVCAQKR